MSFVDGAKLIPAALLAIIIAAYLLSWAGLWVRVALSVAAGIAADRIISGSHLRYVPTGLHGSLSVISALVTWGVVLVVLELLAQAAGGAPFGTRRDAYERARAGFAWGSWAVRHVGRRLSHRAS